METVRINRKFDELDRKIEELKRRIEAIEIDLIEQAAKRDATACEHRESMKASVRANVDSLRVEMKTYIQSAVREAMMKS